MEKEVKTPMNVYWLVHPTETPELGRKNREKLEGFLKRIGQSRSMLVVNAWNSGCEINNGLPIDYFSLKRNPQVYSFPEEHMFPSGEDIKRLDSLLRVNYQTSLSNSNFYLFGWHPFDCVKSTAETMAFGTASTYDPRRKPTDPPKIVSPKSLSESDWSLPICDIEKIHFIGDLGFELYDREFLNGKPITLFDVRTGKKHEVKTELLEQIKAS